jgi:small conductance mechanosensitive channel
VTFKLDRWRELLDARVVPFGIKLAIALAIFFVGRWIARVMIRGSQRLMERGDIDVSLRKFLSDVLYAVLLVAVVTAALDSIGIRTTAVVAVLGAAGLAVGLALRDSLSNFAAGVMIIVLRHYKIGDVIIVKGFTGKVDAIKVFHTILHTTDNRQITVPNGQIITAPIENITTLGRRRVNLKLSIAHGANLHQVKELVEGVALADPRVHAMPRPELELTEIAADNLVLYMRPWVAADDMAPVSLALLERVRETLDTEGVKFTAAIDGV